MNRLWGEVDKEIEDLIFNRNIPKEVKGGKDKMETKSRYEVIADLEEKKRDLIRERDCFPDEVKKKKKDIKNTKRTLEDEEEDLKEFESTLKVRTETIKELIRGIEQSLERFGKLSSKK